MRVFFHAYCEVFAHFGAEPVMKATRRMLKIAAYKKPGHSWIDAKTGKVARHVGADNGTGKGLRVFWRFGPHDLRMALRSGEADAMHLAAQWNERAFREGDRLWEACKLPFQPVRMAGEECAGIFDAAPIGKRQDRGALGVAYFERKSLGAWRASEFHGAPDIGNA
ncbi:hypothetical protein T281_11260 [Rhodomicrobium udaipurense JA643]|nr:hypothetical protein T281_11260 [Rhodomicrobium udaipurense JA643]